MGDYALHTLLKDRKITMEIVSQSNLKPSFLGLKTINFFQQTSIL
jgi:hypothetical protein